MDDNSCLGLSTCGYCEPTCPANRRDDKQHAQQPQRRRIQILERTDRRRKQEIWIDAQMSDIRLGDIFRMFEPDGTPVTDSDGQTWLLATSDAFQKDDVWAVNVLDVTVSRLGVS